MHQPTKKKHHNLAATSSRFQNYFISSKLIQQTSPKYSGTLTNNSKQDLNNKTTCLCINQNQN